jgi:hypothetical protein
VTHKLSEPEALLQALLADGPRESRDVLAWMAERGFTPKQVRRAREKQCIVAQRSGCGASCQRPRFCASRHPGS